MKPLPTIEPDDLVGRTYLKPPNEKGERLRAYVRKKIVHDPDHEHGDHVQDILFHIDVGEGKAEEIISYNLLLEHLQAASENDLGNNNKIGENLFKFRRIVAHQGPLN